MHKCKCINVKFNSASCSFSDFFFFFYRVTHSCYLLVSKKMEQMTFVALFHGLSYNFLSFISSPLSLGLIDGQWLPVWSLLMSLIFQPHQSVSVPFKSHQMRWEPLEPRCAGHWDIGSGLIPPQRTHIDTHVQRHTGLALKWIPGGNYYYFFFKAWTLYWQLSEIEREKKRWLNLSLLQTLFTSVTLCKLFQDWHAEIAEGTEM